MRIADLDLACIGGGLVGIVAAARAAELGLSVAVIEREPSERDPCNSRYSAGLFHASYMDVTLPPAELLAAMRKSPAGHGDDDLLATVANHPGRPLDWL